MESKLGNWALIDIETSGIDAHSDKIIDVGFLQFEGLKLTRTYQSLVQFPTRSNPDERLSQFIQKLTGIKEDSLKKAPAMSEVVKEIQTLAEHQLIAHNADFEKSFLEESFLDINDERERWEDSLYFLALLNPNSSVLNLESYICKWSVRESEVHRGYEDSLDLLKVLLLEVYHLSFDSEFKQHILFQLKDKSLEDWWFAKFLTLSNDELEAIAKEIDFNLIDTYQEYLSSQIAEESAPYLNLDTDFNFSGKTVEDIFSKEEEIQKVLPNYLKRDSQVELAKRVGQSFKNNVHALVQAPTGTGKTLGYLLPAALFSMDEKKQVLVATGTKTLQKQAYDKDIPQLRRLLGEHGKELKVEKLVGSSNHLCELLFRNSDDGEIFDTQGDFESKFTQMFYENLFFCNGRDLDGASTRGDIPFVLRKKLKDFEQTYSDVAVDFKSCTGKRCPFKGNCSYVHGLKKAKDADIIIGNHALMFSWTKSFPRPGHIVVDEAHRLEKEATDAFSFELSTSDLNSLQKSLAHLQGLGSLFYLLAQTEENAGDSTETIGEIRAQAISSATKLKEIIDFLDISVESHFKKLPRYTEIYWNEITMFDGKNEISAMGKSIVGQLEQLQALLGELVKMLLPYVDKFDLENFNDDALVTAQTRFANFYTGIDDVYQTVKFVLEYDESYAHSLKYKADFGFLFQSSPVDVGKVLSSGLLEVSESVVMTSATLSNADGSLGSKGMEWVTGYLYLDPEKRFKSAMYLPSIYDYKNRAKVFLCDDTPRLGDPEFVKKTLEPVSKILKELGGRSLLLFGAKNRFEKAREFLIDKFEGEIPLFIQGMGNNVVEQFKESGQGILLGMESFGEGIDVPGDALKFVFIDKIPDVSMDHVIQERRAYFDREIGNEFTDYYLSHRSRSLHQKLGRLLRTTNDFGAVIVVDSRFKSWKRETVKKFFRLMEPYQMNKTPLKDACDQVRELFH